MVFRPHGVFDMLRVMGGDVLGETLDALEMPRHGVRKWIAHNRRFCEAHGGRRVYGELMELLDRTERALDEAERREGGDRASCG